MKKVCNPGPPDKANKPAPPPAPPEKAMAEIIQFPFGAMSLPNGTETEVCLECGGEGYIIVDCVQYIECPKCQGVGK